MMKDQLNWLSEKAADWSPLTWWYWPSEVWDTEEKIGWRNGERQSSGSRVSLPNCGHYVHPNCSGWQSSLTIVFMCLDLSFNNIFPHIETPMEIPMEDFYGNHSSEQSIKNCQIQKTFYQSTKKFKFEDMSKRTGVLWTPFFSTVYGFIEPLPSYRM